METCEYALDVNDRVQVAIPSGARCLSVVEQNGRPVVYFLVNSDSETVMVTFRIVGTGHPLEDSFNRTHWYIGTVVCGALVWHLWVVRDDASDMLNFPPR